MRPRRDRTFIAALLCVAATSCATEPSEPRSLAVEEGPPVFRPGTFTDMVPAEAQTVIQITQEETEEGIVPVGRFDSSAGHFFFPLEREPRYFENVTEFAEFAQQTVGASVLTDPQTGEITGASGNYVAVGDSFFYDPEIDLYYLIEDPISAYLGGRTGQMFIGAEEICMDPDQECDGESLASYIVPNGTTTRSTSLTDCDSGATACSTGHSFFNEATVPPLFTWARHGVNERMTRGSAIGGGFFTPHMCAPGEEPHATFELCTSGEFQCEFSGFTWDCDFVPGECAEYSFCGEYFPATTLDADGFWTYRTFLAFPPLDSVGFIAVNETGQSSVETATWCWQEYNSDTSLRCNAANAVAVCGTSHVDDFRIGFATHRTGNGPSNTAVCGAD